MPKRRSVLIVCSASGLIILTLLLYWRRDTSFETQIRMPLKLTTRPMVVTKMKARGLRDPAYYFEISAEPETLRNLIAELRSRSAAVRQSSSADWWSVKNAVNDHPEWWPSSAQIESSDLVIVTSHMPDCTFVFIALNEARQLYIVKYYR